MFAMAALMAAALGNKVPLSVPDPLPKPLPVPLALDPRDELPDDWLLRYDLGILYTVSAPYTIFSHKKDPPRKQNKSFARASAALLP